MKNTTKHLEDLSEIRHIMERSTRFLSLSGWSGIFAGTFALLGALLAYIYLVRADMAYESAESIVNVSSSPTIRTFLLIDAAIVLFLALLSAVYFSWKKALKQGEKIWSPVTKRMLFHLAVPLISGGILCLILLAQDSSTLIAPLTLIFYGLALVNAGKYTNREAVWLGLSELVLGLFGVMWQEYALYLWALGFGIFHVVYGITLYYKYDRKGI